VDAFSPKAHSGLRDPGAIVCVIRRRRLTEERAMHAVVRTYSGEGAKELFDLLEKRKSDVESLIRTVKGFVSYSLVRTADGGISVTVCQDKAGADDSVQKAKDWIGGNASNIGASAPKVSEGSVILHLK
jgi:restriction endonuclease Mrr